jgi:hypothetical protein
MQANSILVDPFRIVPNMFKSRILQGFLCFDSVLGSREINLPVLRYPRRFHAKGFLMSLNP